MSWRYWTFAKERSKRTNDYFRVLTPPLALRLPKMEESQALGWFILLRWSFSKSVRWWKYAGPKWSKWKRSWRSWWRISDSHVWYAWLKQEATYLDNTLKSTWVRRDSWKWIRSFHWKLFNQKQDQKAKWCCISGAKTKISIILTEILSTPKWLQSWPQFERIKEITSRGHWKQTYTQSHLWNLQSKEKGLKHSNYAPVELRY